MTALETKAGAPLARKHNWDHINWYTVENLVRRLQLRIAKAIKEGRYHRAKALQWLLTHSYYAKLLAIRRVTQNKGKNTPGVDNVIWKTSKEKLEAVKLLKRRGYNAQPLRRKYIPKKNGKQRPLGIPTMIDRAQQALHLLGLDPIAEILADKNSYGFRPKRSLQDAVQQCFIVLSKKRSHKWILEGDIKACFDKISHSWLIQNVMMDKKILKQWIDSGYIEKNTFHQTKEGTPQGGVISPVLANIALDGLEKVVKDSVSKGDRVNFVRYADDFICTAPSREILEEKVQPAIIAFLHERGLELSLEKTKITNIDEGFDFLGFNIRKYRGKLLIKPAKKSVKSFLDNIKETIRNMRGANAEALIKTLNPKIKGWANHYQHHISKNTFYYVDSQIFSSIWKWAVRGHANKGRRWIASKYFTQEGLRRWCFFAKTNKGKNRILLTKASDTRIVRYTKIRANATPYDPEFQDYFLIRDIKRKYAKKNDR